MIITCPSCATRYDVDDGRFSPDGRSVRCAECDESWFVPAPQPIENLMPLKPKGRKAEAPTDDRRERSFRRDDAHEEGVDEPLFEAPAKSGRFRVEEEKADVRGDSRTEPKPHAKDEHGERPGLRYGAEREPERQPPRREGERDFGRDFGLARPDAREGKDLRAVRDREVVDADFEDLGRPSTDFYADPTERGFGRKARDERRRETALARLEDLEPIAERVFNEEFFTALRVQPKELERAIRKARRRAESREKNRLTPFSVLGWSAWVGAIAACGFVAYSYRNNIVALFPNAAGAYEAVGIEANPYGLKIEGVTHRVAMSPQGPVIEILGRLRNEAKAAVAPPMLQAEALSGDGDVLSRWTFPARADKVAAGASVDFSTRAPAPEGVAEVLLSFAPAEGVKVSVGDLIKTQN